MGVIALATVIYRTSDIKRGVWLLDRNAIAKLDEIIEESWREMEGVRTQCIEEQIRAKPENWKEEEWKSHLEGRYPFSIRERNITISFKQREKVAGTSFKEILESPSTANQEPVSFDVDLSSADISCKVTFDDNRLSIRVSPEQHPLSSTLFVRFEQWAEIHELSKFICYWREWRSVGLLIYSLSSVIAMVFARYQVPKYPNLDRDVLNLLDKGITESNVPKAVELILRVLSVPKEEEIIHYKSWLYIFILATLPILFISFFPPTSKFAVGKGAQAVERQKKWLRLVLVLIPSFLFLGVAASILGSAVFEWMR